MVDYKFGNRLAELRRAKGYSQFQLATMMNVTDKAVSKWETGIAKPRATACTKLASLLGVDVDLLMDNDALTENEADALLSSQRNLLWEKAEARMKELYGEEPPLRILNRFMMERNALHRSNAVIMFDILAQVLSAARQNRAGFDPGGAVCFVSWLLGATEVNPLEPHLRCPKCRRVEFHPEVMSGWDLPEKICECGARMIPDGQDIPMEVCVMSGGNPFEFFWCELDESFMPEAERIILTCGEQFFNMERFHENGSDDFERSPEGNPVRDPETGKPIPVRHFPFTSLMFRLKKKARIRKPERITGPNDLENWGRRSGQPAIALLGGFYGPSYLSQPSPFRSTPEELVRQDVMARALRSYWQYRQAEAEMFSDLKLPDLSPYLNRLSFGTFITLICAANNLYMTAVPEELAERIGFSDFTDMPLSMEDLWKVISRSTVYPGYMSGAACEILCKTGTGKYLCTRDQQGIGSRERRLFEEMNLPEWFETYASNVMDLCFRSRCIELGIRLLEDARRKIRDGK